MKKFEIIDLCEFFFPFFLVGGWVNMDTKKKLARIICKGVCLFQRNEPTSPT